eukprot:739610-Alexandrium_andersonii.AAC.1
MLALSRARAQPASRAPHRAPALQRRAEGIAVVLLAVARQPYRWAVLSRPVVRAVQRHLVWRLGALRRLGLRLRPVPRAR